MYVCVYIFNIYMPCSMLTVLVYSSACQQRPIALRVGAYKSAKVTWVFLLPAVSSQQSPQQQHQPSWALSRNFAECAKSVKQRADKHTHTRTHPHTRTVCRLQSNAKAHKWYQTKECCGCVACRLDFMTTSSRCATMRLVLLPTCHIHAAFTLASERVGFGLWQRAAGSGPVRWRRLRQWSSGAVELMQKHLQKLRYTRLYIYI